MGARFELHLVVDKVSKGVKVWENVVAELEKLDQIMNRFAGESEISRVNRLAATQPVPVSDELWSIINDCELYHRLTLGLFDITLRDFTKLQLDKEAKTVYFEDAEIRFDLGAFAKGYAIEKIRKIITKSGIQHFFINFGSSSVCGVGIQPEGEPWSVDIENPFVSGQQLDTIVLKDQCLSVSGNSPDNQLHIIRPSNRKFVNNRRLMCVATSNAAVAEVLSTAFLLATDKEKNTIAQKFTEFIVFKSSEYSA
jgi:thiamine biosynthesis lipoprotein